MKTQTWEYNMAKNPAFPFYVNDFEGGTRHMTDAELGCYMRLLLAQFNSKDGTIPADIKFLERYSNSIKESWPIVQEKFLKISKDKLQNERMETERVKRLLFINHQSENGKKFGRGKTKSLAADNPITTQAFSKSNSKAKAKHNPLGNGYGKGNKTEKVGMGGKDAISLPLTGFFSDSLPKDVLLNELQIGATTRFISLTCHVTITENDVGDRWEAFKIQNFGAHEWYNSYEKLLSHFRNSLKIEVQKNGAAYRKDNNGKSTGTSQSRVEAVRNLR